jgi:formiminotetrahydrofolate cyclodeaminase
MHALQGNLGAGRPPVNDVRAMTEEPIEGWLDDLASGSSESGSGAFAALSAAAGAALVTSVVHQTLRRLGPDDAEVGRLAEIADACEAARPSLLGAAGRDGDVQHELSLAARMPQGSEDERTARLVTLQSVLEDAVDVQLDLARRSVLLAGLAEEATAAADPNAAADGLAAVSALHAAAVAALANVALNSFAIADVERRAELAATCAALGERAARMLADAHAAFSSRLDPAPS